MTEQFIIGFFSGAGTILLCWVKNIWQTSKQREQKQRQRGLITLRPVVGPIGQIVYLDPTKPLRTEHSENEAPTLDCHCRTCEAARAAKT